MSEAGEAARELLSEKPSFRPHVREVLDADDSHDEWGFDDVDLDSGVFGELVSRGIVEKTGDGYRVADPGGVEAALEGETPERQESSESWAPEIQFDRGNAAVLAGLLLFVVALRAYIYPQVFRGGDVVLLSNDPYNYLYLVERLVETGFTEVPPGIQGGEPLMVYTLALVSTAVGGVDAAAGVLAWYPIASAVVTASLVYLFAKKLTGDARVGLAAVAFLAVTPAHSFRTALGYADHHAFDYPWLALTVLALLFLSRVDSDDLRKPRTWLWTTVLGVALTGQVLSWDNSPILIAPLGAYAALLTLRSVRGRTSPSAALAPFIAALVLSSVLSTLVHVGLGWHSPEVAYSPALLLAGVTGVSVVGEAAYRLDLSAYVLAILDATIAAAGLVAFTSLFPDYANRLQRGVDTLLADRAIAETRSLLVTDFTVSLFGLLLALAVPVLVWVAWRAYRDNRSDYLLVAVYAAYFLFLSVLQRRFTGELSLLAAVLAGIGFVYLLGWIEVARPFQLDGKIKRVGLPDNSWDVASVVLLFLVVSSLSYPYVHLRNQDLVIEEETYRAAKFMQGYSERNGLEYPDNYVFSYWSRNRMLNYFVNGESKSYSYARTNYEDFISSREPDTEYEELTNRDRAGFVIIRDILTNTAPPGSTYAVLDRWGSSGAGVSGTGHYQGLYAGSGGRPKVFRVVPGAVITGNSSVSPVEVRTEVSLPGDTFVYRREVPAEGSFEVRVPYPGTYRVGDSRVNVSRRAVLEGRTVSLGG